MTITLDAATRERARRSTVRWRHLADLDPILLAASLVLSVLGVVFVWSATTADQIAADADPTAFAKRQALSVAIGVGLAYATSRIPYHLLRVVAPWLYTGSVILVALTFTPLGTEIAGARAWLALPGGFTLQPAEFAKIGVILALAAIAAANVGREPTNRQLVTALAVAGVPVGLVLLQNDTGTMLVLAATAFTVIVVGGAPLRWVLGLLASAAAGVFLVIQLGLLQDYQMDRLTSFLNPDAFGLGAGFNTAQARIAIGGGGLFGQGLFQGSQTQGAFVPVNESDFIFTVVAEELGLVGALIVIGLLFLIFWRGLRIAAEADDLFGRLVAVGIVAWFAFQAFENIGMSLGIMPVTGVTLPFVSYGGSSVMATWIAVGVLQVLHIRRRRGALVRPEARHWRSAQHS